MIDDVTRRLLVREGDRLAPALFEGVDDALARTSLALPGLLEREHPHLFSGAKRAYFREALKGGALPHGWVVRGNPRRNGQLELVHDSNGVSLRVLAESRLTTNGVPHAGHTFARRLAWTAVQVPLFSLPGEIRRDRKFLLLVSFNAAVPTLRIVRPVAPGRYHGLVPCDYNLVLNTSHGNWEDRSFVGNPAVEDLFTVQVSDEEVSHTDV